MIHLGAIPFCRTNVPQGVASFDCSNPIFGTTCHPRDPSRSPGGSTGGEGALIAMKGSIIGIGKPKDKFQLKKIQWRAIQIALLPVYDVK